MLTQKLCNFAQLRSDSMAVLHCSVHTVA